MPFPKKFKLLLEPDPASVSRPDYAWLCYAVCACDADACGSQKSPSGPSIPRAPGRKDAVSIFVWVNSEGSSAVESSSFRRTASSIPPGDRRTPIRRADGGNTRSSSFPNAARDSVGSGFAFIRVPPSLHPMAPKRTDALASMKARRCITIILAPTTGGAAPSDWVDPPSRRTCARTSPRTQTPALFPLLLIIVPLLSLTWSQRLVGSAPASSISSLPRKRPAITHAGKVYLRSIALRTRARDSSASAATRSMASTSAASSLSLTASRSHVE